VFDASGTCIFTTFAWTLADIAAADRRRLRGRLDAGEAGLVGERIWNMERSSTWRPALRQGRRPAAPPQDRAGQDRPGQGPGQRHRRRCCRSTTTARLGRRRACRPRRTRWRGWGCRPPGGLPSPALPRLAKGRPAPPAPSQASFCLRTSMKAPHHRQRPHRRHRRRNPAQGRSQRPRSPWLGDEPEPPYSRMAIPYLLKATSTRRAPTCARARGTSSPLASSWCAAAPWRSTPRAQRAVHDGASLGYDRLLVATGSHPLRAAHPRHGPAPNVHTCWTLEDARAIAELAKSGRACCNWVPASSAASSWRRSPRAACSSPWWRWATAWCRA
jgi:hypothetical protein